MTNQTVKINWEELVKTSGRGYPQAALNYPEIVKISSHNEDGTITVITGHNDFGTPMVVRVDPLSEFVTEIEQNAPSTMSVIEKLEAKLESNVTTTNKNLSEYISQNDIPDFFPPGIDEQFDRLLGAHENAKYELKIWNES